MENDLKKRYMLIEGPDDTTPTAGEVWWIRANQGHSLKVLFTCTLSVENCADIDPGGRTGSEANSLGRRYSHGSARDKQGCMGLNLFVLVTSMRNITDSRDVAGQGLSRRTRNHIHLAQGVPEDGVISGLSLFHGISVSGLTLPQACANPLRF